MSVIRATSARTDRTMQTLIIFLQNLIVSATLVYATYILMRLTAYCVLWSIGKLSFKIKR
jgi:hypothetical protein